VTLPVRKVINSKTSRHSIFTPSLRTGSPVPRWWCFPAAATATWLLTHEGEQIARWWNSLGVSAFVLRYRLGPKCHHPVKLGDALRAIRWVRSQAGEYRFQTDRIGVMGFSAGGHLASSAATLFDEGTPTAQDSLDRISSRPDFPFWPIQPFRLRPSSFTLALSATYSERTPMLN
jgi:hypothetical protein